VLDDEGGDQARIFGAATSGHVLLYRADGCLLFSGGITDSRGHAGASVGFGSIVSLLTGDTPAQTAPPVFGCPLSNPLPAESEGPPTCCKK
jgi:hypothetical protein